MVHLVRSATVCAPIDVFRRTVERHRSARGSSCVSLGVPIETYGTAADHADVSQDSKQSVACREGRGLAGHSQPPTDLLDREALQRHRDEVHANKDVVESDGEFDPRVELVTEHNYEAGPRRRVRRQLRVHLVPSA